MAEVRGHLESAPITSALPRPKRSGIFRTSFERSPVMPDTRASGIPSHGGPVQLFYAKKGAPRRPMVTRAEGIYMWDTEGKRYIDASSGPVVSNIGHGNERVVRAMTEQARKVAFASRAVFENEPNVELADLVTSLAGPGLERALFVSGGSEATEAAIKLARQYAVVRGETQRWKVIAREPGYHGGTLGALAVTGDPEADRLFGALMKPMPKVPAPFTYRLPANHDADSYARQCAAALEDAIKREGPETVLAFIMEPVGGLALGAVLAPASMVEAVAESGGFMHGHTYAANPLSCAVGVAVVREMIERKMMANAQAMGARLRERLEAVQAKSPLLGDIRGKGLLMAIEIVVDKEAKTPPPAELQAVYRIIELGLERGIALYSRRTANGRYGEWLMVAPPLIVTAAEVDEIADLIGATLAAYEEELRRKRVI